MPCVLGLDSSTQSLSAILLDLDAREAIADYSVDFDERLGAKYGVENGVLPNDDPQVKHSPPQMWLEALDLLLGDLKSQGVNLSQVVAVAGSGQQHGSVYLNPRGVTLLGQLDPHLGLADQLDGCFSRETSPIWMDASTWRECQEMTEALGGPKAVAELTGSCCFERFTGTQIRRFWKSETDDYDRTARIHLVSSFMASVLAGAEAPLDPGDGAGMNLMDIRTKAWSPAAIEACAPRLRSKLPPIAPADTVVGPIAPYFVEKYGFSPDCKACVWSGDNPNSLVGVGLVSSGKICLSLGTSDTYFGYMPEAQVDPAGEGHCFGSPTGAYMSLICFRNGSLARERVRDAYGMDWPAFSAALRATPVGNGGRLMLPYFDTEIVPNVLEPKVWRFGLDEADGPANCRAVVEAQQLSMRIHSRWMGVDSTTIYATGGASANREILEVMANVHNAEVYQFPVGNSAALGAALRAAHAWYKGNGDEQPWEQIVSGYAEPVAASRLAPDPASAAVYNELIPVYNACEDHALRGGPDPAPLQEAFRAK